MIPLEKLEKLIPTSLLDAVAVEYKVNAANQVRLPGQAVFLCLLNALMNHPILTQRLLEEQYTKQIGRKCDHSSFGKRLSVINPEFFHGILGHLRTKLGPKITNGDQQALKLRIVDAVTVTLSAKLLGFGIKVDYKKRGSHSHVKSVVELTEGSLPDLLHICSKKEETCDSLALGSPMEETAKPRDLFIFDRGCNQRKRLFAIHNKGAFWLTPHHRQKLCVIETISESDPSVPSDPPELDDDLCRIHKVELTHFDNRAGHRVEGLESMQIVLLHCHRWDRRVGQWKPFVLMTNLPLSACRTKAGPYTFEELLALYARRWEIETFFKLLKQHLGLEHLLSRSENGIRVMILMTLISALLLVWYKSQTKIDRGWRSVKFWFADDLRSWTAQALNAMLVAGET